MATKNKLSKLSTKSNDIAVTSTGYKMSGEDQARQRRYAAEEALRTITRAEEHKRDRALMKDVKQCAREQAKTLNCVLGKK